MAKKKHPLADLGIEDPDGEEWQGKAEQAWSRAVERSERARAEAENEAEAAPAIAFYDAPPLPQFEKSEAVAGDVFGRFVYQPGPGLVHDVTRASAACRVDEELPRVFVHFAHELERAIPDDAAPHGECMG